MIRTALLCLLGWFLLAPGVAESQEKTRAALRLRVLTYNIHHGEGMDKKLDLKRIAGAIKAANPDLVALQEVDHRTGRTKDVDQAARLGELTGMHAYFAKAMDYRGGGYGNAILSRHKPLSTRTFPLPADKDKERRSLGEARVKLGDTGPTLVFYSTHLDHSDAKHRTMQIAEITRITSEEKEPLAILAGDLNAQPGSREIETLLKNWKDATARPDLKTFPAKAPNIKIDYIIYRSSPRIKMIEAQVLEEKVASDHAPVLAVFEITD